MTQDKKKQQEQPNPQKLKRQITELQKEIEMRQREKELLQEYLERGDFTKPVHKFMNEHSDWVKMNNEAKAKAYLNNNTQETERAKRVKEKLEEMKNKPLDKENMQKKQQEIQKLSQG